MYEFCKSFRVIFTTNAPASLRLAILQRGGFLIKRLIQRFLSGGTQHQKTKCTLGGVEYRLDIYHDTTFYLFCIVSIKSKGRLKLSTYKVETIPGVGRADSAEVAVGGRRVGDTVRGPSDVGQVDACN